MGNGGPGKKHYQFEIKADVTIEDLADIIQNMFPQGGASEYFYKTIKEETRRHLREMTEEELDFLPDGFR
jgi:hypothetical protein